MIKNYLKISWRNLKRDKSYSLINIFGLAIGIAACLMISLYIIDELSYDKFHDNSDRTYRLYVDGQFGNNKFLSPYIPNPTKDALLDEFSQIESVTHFFDTDQVRFEYENKIFIENRVLYADSDFFEVFSFPMVKGEAKNALSEPNQIVLTESSARKYFGDEDPLGKMIKVNRDELFQVTGVCEDVPDNSHFHFNYLLSYSSSHISEDQRWINSSVYTYFVLKEGVEQKNFEKQLDLLVEKYVGPEVVNFMGVNLEEFENRGNSYGFFLQPLEDIYLHSDFNDEIEPVSNITRIWYFSIIAVFILLIACINFMNLATAKYANRAKEVGIRKVVGSKRKQLISQFLTESILISTLAVIVAIVLVEFFLPGFNNISQKSLELEYFTSWNLLPVLIGLAIIVGVIAGIYPAFFLSSFSPLKILKGKINKGVKGDRLRGALVTSQFVITIVLFISTYLIFQQNSYMTNKKLGFDKEEVLILERAYYLDESLESFVKELTKSPQIHSASVSNSIPGRDYSGSTLQVEGRSSEDMVFFAINYVGEGYHEAMGIELIEGRFFSEDFSTNESSIVINKKGAEELGFENPIGKYLQLGDERYNIIGIVENHHFESLHRNIRPLGMRYEGSSYYDYMPIKLNTNNLNETIEYVEAKWNKFTNNQPFSYFFMDDDFEKLYDAEQRTAKVFTVFSVLAILIACLGLFGLSAFMAEKRTKEIGIRKAMGASPLNILRLLYKEVVLLLLISIIIAWPVTYYLMNQWLSDFAYRIGIGVMPFIFASFAALVIAIFTTSFQALKAANTNPAYTLRDE
ncbi:MAG: ABC transporter permease [Bacteroidales bacterium]